MNPLAAGPDGFPAVAAVDGDGSVIEEEWWVRVSWNWNWNWSWSSGIELRLL